jgi:hypothetical protein
MRLTVGRQRSNRMSDQAREEELKRLRELFEELHTLPWVVSTKAADAEWADMSPCQEWSEGAFCTRPEKHRGRHHRVGL